MPHKDREKRLAYGHQHYQDNKQVISAKAKLYRARNQEKIRAAHKKYYELNREKVAAAKAKWARDNRDRMRASARRSYQRHLHSARDRSYDRCLAKMYGMTREQYDKMVAAQNGLCAICKKPPTRRVLDVDHDHKTGQVRGLLCRKCNILIGYLETSADLLDTVSGYLGKA